MGYNWGAGSIWVGSVGTFRSRHMAPSLGFTHICFPPRSHFSPPFQCFRCSILPLKLGGCCSHSSWGLSSVQ